MFCRMKFYSIRLISSLLISCIYLASQRFVLYLDLRSRTLSLAVEHFSQHLAELRKLSSNCIDSQAQNVNADGMYEARLMVAVFYLEL